MTPPGRFELAATRVVFFVFGLVMSAWAPLVPLAKARVALGEAALGGVLLCLGLGSVLAMPFSGGLAARHGCRRVIAVAGGLAVAALPILAVAGNAPTLALGLLLFGAGLGTVDVVMNIQAVLVERASGRTLMSGVHGLFSLGTVAGAGFVSTALALGVVPLGAVLFILVMGVSAMALYRRGLLPYGGEADGPAFAVPRGPIVGVGVLCFILFLAEGTVLDWSAVLATARGAASGQAGLGQVAFAAAMTLVRLTGDRVVDRFGSPRVLVVGTALGAVGLAGAALASSWPLATVGFALLGAGLANAVPLLFSAAGRQSAMPGHLAITAVTTLGYAGLLAGPALVGVAAQAITLPLSLLLVAAALAGVALVARRVVNTGVPA